MKCSVKNVLEISQTPKWYTLFFYKLIVILQLLASSPIKIIFSQFFSKFILWIYSLYIYIYNQTYNQCIIIFFIYHNSLKWERKCFFSYQCLITYKVQKSKSIKGKQS